jgi:insulysin
MSNIIKSKSDKRTYSYFRLSNLLKCVLVHDSEADKSAAAMNVNVGSLLDPVDFPGLAHFLEHMLFMGTKKYPEENDFSEFLNKNNEYSNAYTDLDSTNYYFEVNNQNFESALDRFSQFFTFPLFNASAFEREVQAVDSEHSKNIQSDLWRQMQLIRSESNPNSIFNRFATGNLETLNKPLLREALVDFHKNYYSSHLMTLAIVSNKSIDEMKKLVENLFSEIPKYNEMDKYLKYPNIEENHTNFLDTKKINKTIPYDKNECGYLYHILPVKDIDVIYLYWFFDYNFNIVYKKKPLDYISSVLGHEGPNSLTSCLVKDDLISDLSAGGYTQANTMTTFYFKIYLTKKGLKSIEEIIKRVYEAIRNLKNKPVDRRYFDEIKNISEIKFDYKGKEDPTDYCSDLANRLITKPAEDILIGDYIY